MHSTLISGTEIYAGVLTTGMLPSIERLYYTIELWLAPAYLPSQNSLCP